MSGHEHQAGATRPYSQPEASQAERRNIIRAEALGLNTFHAIAAAEAAISGGHVTGAGPAPLLPVSNWAVDPCGIEPPLNVDVNALPDLGMHAAAPATSSQCPALIRRV